MSLFFLLFVIAAIVYFLPTVIGLARHKQNAMAIFALNLFLGWTLLGWVVAIVWALTVDRAVVDLASPSRFPLDKG